jgi:hypothetical protein
MTSKFHLLNLSIAFMSVVALASAFVWQRLGAGVIDLGTLGQKREMKAQSRQILVIGKEHLLEREREGKNEGKEDEFPKEQRTVPDPMYRFSSWLCLSQDGKPLGLH